MVQHNPIEDKRPSINGNGRIATSRRPSPLSLQEVYLNLARNHHFNKGNSSLTPFPLAITLRLPKEKEELARQLREFVEEKTKGILEEYVSERGVHFLIYLMNTTELEETLKGPLHAITPRENIRNTPLTFSAILEQASRLLEKK